MRISKLKIVVALLFSVNGARAAEKMPEGTTAKPVVNSKVVEGSADSNGRVYIAVGDPNVRKVLLAVERTGGNADISKEFADTLVSDMDFTDLFELLPADKFPANSVATAIASPILNSYKVLGVEFLLRSAVRLNSGNYEAEVRLFDVNRGVQILGRLYPLVSQSSKPGRELAHFAANDVVQSLTGVPGIFRTRLLMSCGKNFKKTDKRSKKESYEKLTEIYIMDFDGQNVR